MQKEADILALLENNGATIDETTGRLLITEAPKPISDKPHTKLKRRGRKLIGEKDATKKKKCMTKKTEKNTKVIS